MKTERQEMPDREVCDPLDVELGNPAPVAMAGRTRTRDLRQAPAATREAAAAGRRRLLGALFGADGVVTRDVPEGVLAAGNPCRGIREVTE